MQKWLDKAAVAAVAVFLSAGLLIALPALGAYWQYKLTEDAWKIIEAHIARKAGGYVPPMPGRCGTCGTTITSGSAFCSGCGANLQGRAHLRLLRRAAERPLRTLLQPLRQAAHELRGVGFWVLGVG